MKAIGIAASVVAAGVMLAAPAQADDDVYLSVLRDDYWTRTY